MPCLDDAAIIGLGANLENPVETLRRALARLESSPSLNLTAVSPVYLTEPQGGPAGQSWYHNAVAFFQCGLSPHDLLALLLTVEKELGRLRREHWGPRVIDLDLLAFGRQMLEEPGLTVPHPRMAERLFVMAPLAETAPGWLDPRNGNTAAKILAAIDTAGQGLERSEIRL